LGYKTDTGQKCVLDTAFVRPSNRLCHRIDSACVTTDFASSKKLFPISPVQLRYDDLETNAHTQANGRMWEKSVASRYFKFQTPHAIQTYGDMYTQNLDIASVFTTSTTDIWAEKTKSKPVDQCPVVKITWAVGLTVQPFVLNSAQLGDEVKFSHVIYSDRVLQRRHYDDGTEQQLYAHHFSGGVSDRNAGRHMTSPTPLMSYCDDTPEAKTYGSLHRFKLVKFENIGKTRMYERYHRFNQDIGVDHEFEPSGADTEYLTTAGQTFLGNTPLRLLKSYYDFWQHENVQAQGMLGSGLFFNSQFRWTTSKTPSTAPNSELIDNIQNTCVLRPIRKLFARETTTDACNAAASGEWQHNPHRVGVGTDKYENPMLRIFPKAKLPLGDAEWDAYTLAAY